MPPVKTGCTEAINSPLEGSSPVSLYISLFPVKIQDLSIDGKASFQGVGHADDLMPAFHKGNPLKGAHDGIFDGT